MTRELIAVLRSDASQHDKARACQQLAVAGDKETVPVLATLLSDEKLACYARSALEAIADPSAGDALREALGRLHGNLLAGVINSLGGRRDKQSVPVLSKLAGDSEPVVADAAMSALGRIATPEAAAVLKQGLTADAAAARFSAADAGLICAERLLAEGKRADALAIYDGIFKAEVPKHVRAAAARGALLARKPTGR